MQIKRWILCILIGSVLAGTIGWQRSMAQEADYVLAHDDVFGDLRRPAVSFPHERHTAGDQAAECGECHHGPEDQTGRLVYIEGEERSSKECHDYKEEDDIPALREAYHASCTGCHRNLIKAGNLKSGPTTCGGCHPKT